MSSRRARSNDEGDERATVPPPPLVPALAQLFRSAAPVAAALGGKRARRGAERLARRIDRFDAAGGAIARSVAEVRRALRDDDSNDDNDNEE